MSFAASVSESKQNQSRLCRDIANHSAFEIHSAKGATARPQISIIEPERREQLTEIRIQVTPAVARARVAV